MKNVGRIEIQSIKSYSNSYHSRIDCGSWFGDKIKYFLIFNSCNHGKRAFEYCRWFDYTNRHLAFIKDKD